jgi:histidine triad (HIT) family protein
MKTCTFCGIIAGETTARVILRTESAVAFLDISPVNTGHTIIVPTRHVRSFTDLSAREVCELAIATQQAAAVLKAKLEGCVGVSITLADGEGAGQEVPHVHFHVIPRFPSDDFGWSRFGSRMEKGRLDEIAATLQTPSGMKTPTQRSDPTSFGVATTAKGPVAPPSDAGHP